ncbi:MAG TPA: acetyl-CoA carboxylase biotin carboxylase subunit [Clostridiales bacterium]|nr:acetyl-CoA carboxylase biotin carboxylase subunit [Clostridiales bacterium]
MIKKVLIANRGEIAVRVIRACREMGIETVAVYSTADADALHTQLADEAVCIGPPAPADSYLNPYNILSAASITGADAVHPGYGFLSENSKFVRMCNKSNVTFIGPDAESMEKMGDKLMARKIMREADVPVIPGSEGALADVREAKKCAGEVGYPVMIKAAHGGGGRGIRKVLSEEEMAQAFDSAQKEALGAFGDGTLYMEKCIEDARHIEVQILCDNYGKAVYLFERECSLQRRNQKVMEEAPSVALTKLARREMGQAAVRAAKASGYKSAGTIEFLLDSTGRYYFMELNARVQVEHPVTEMVTGIDIVREQILIAGGGKLSFGQEHVKLNGCAIECRINAEDPSRNFMPSIGKINVLHFPGGPGVRFDTAMYTDYKIPPQYDSMIGKLIVHAPTRDKAMAKMRAALTELVVDGVDTNADFQLLLLSDEDVRAGKLDTGLVGRIMERYEKKYGGTRE